MTGLADLKVKIFADGADRGGMLDLYRNPLVKGFTTNPTLMRAAGITDYEGFAREILAAIPDRPISLEVFSDDFAEMEIAGPPNRVLGRERLRQNSSNQYSRRVVGHAGPSIGESGGQAECHGADDTAAGS